MAGYLGAIRARQSVGYHEPYDVPTGYALLARDVTALEENDRGWQNLPPWGYARQRGLTFAPTISGFGGLVGLGAAFDAALVRLKEDVASAESSAPVPPPTDVELSAANDLLQAIDYALRFGSESPALMEAIAQKTGGEIGGLGPRPSPVSRYISSLAYSVNDETRTILANADADRRDFNVDDLNAARGSLQRMQEQLKQLVAGTLTPFAIIHGGQTREEAEAVVVRGEELSQEIARQQAEFCASKTNKLIQPELWSKYGCTLIDKCDMAYQALHPTSMIWECRGWGFRLGLVGLAGILAYAAYRRVSGR